MKVRYSIENVDIVRTIYGGAYVAIGATISVVGIAFFTAGVKGLFYGSGFRKAAS